MRSKLIGGALALASMSGAAAAAPSPCLTPAEFASLAGYALPSVISGTAQRCSSALPADAFLRRNGGTLAARYAARKPAAWPGAKDAFLKLSASGNPDAGQLLRSLPDPSLQQMADTLIAGMVAQHLPTDRCRHVDRVVHLLSPLPPESTAELIALAVGLGAKAERAKVGNVAICEA